MNKFPECDGNAEHLISTGCVACLSKTLSTFPMERVESWWHQGIIGNDARRGYMFVWATSEFRWSKQYEHFAAVPDSEEAREYAKWIGSFVPGGRGYC